MSARVRKGRAKKKKEAAEIKTTSKIKFMNPKYIIDNKDNLDFKELSKVYPFTENLAYTLREKIDWNVLYIYNTEIKDRLFFYNNEGYLNWEKISKQKNLPEVALLRCPDRLDWSLICKNTKIKESILEKVYHYLDLSQTAEHQRLSEKFIEDHLDDFKIYMEEICDNQKLSEEFIRNHKDIVDWRAISRSQKLSENFMEEMRDRIDWTWACKSQKMSSKFIENNINDLNLYCLLKRNIYIPKSIKKTVQYQVCKMYMEKIQAAN